MNKRFDDVVQNHLNTNSTTVQSASEIKDMLCVIDRNQATRLDRVTQSASGTEHHLNTIRSDLFQNASHTNTQLSQDVADHLKSFQLQLGASSETHAITAVFHGSAAQAAKSLDYVSPHISELISNISADTGTGPSAEQLRWFVSESERLLDDAVVARAMELKTARAGTSQLQHSSMDRVGSTSRNLLKDAFQSFRRSINVSTRFGSWSSSGRKLCSSRGEGKKAEIWPTHRDFVHHH